MPHQPAEVFHPGGFQHRYRRKLVVHFQRKRRRKPVLFRHAADQGAVRPIHEKRADDHQRQQLAPQQHGKGNVVQVGVTGKHIRLPQGLGVVPRLPVHGAAFVAGEYVPAQQGAIAVGLAKAHKHLPVPVHQLQRKLGISVDGFQYVLHPLPGNQ